MCSSRVKYMSADTKLHLNKDDKKLAFTQQLSRNYINFRFHHKFCDNPALTEAPTRGLLKDVIGLFCVKSWK